MALYGLSSAAFFSALKVEPDALVSQAKAADVGIRRMRSAFTELERIVNGTNAYWIGEAGDAHRQLYQEKKDEIRELFARLSEDVSDLQQMASVYASAEAAAAELAGDLPADVIV